jgi:hypothetical protein
MGGVIRLAFVVIIPVAILLAFTWLLVWLDASGMFLMFVGGAAFGTYATGFVHRQREEHTRRLHLAELHRQQNLSNQMVAQGNAI